MRNKSVSYFSFLVIKGVNEVAADSDSGQVNRGGTDALGFANDPTTSMYTKDAPVAELLDANGVVCTKAAFSEYLYVDAMATDGWGSLDYLDRAGAPIAFALEPET